MAHSPPVQQSNHDSRTAATAAAPPRTMNGGRRPYSKWFPWRMSATDHRLPASRLHGSQAMARSSSSTSTLRAYVQIVFESCHVHLAYVRVCVRARAYERVSSSV